jgi:hypothetical protein
VQSTKEFLTIANAAPRDTHPTLGAAVDAYPQEHAVDWKP